MYWVMSFIIQLVSVIWSIFVIEGDNVDIFGPFQYTIKFLNMLGLLILIGLMFGTVHRSESAPR